MQINEFTILLSNNYTLNTVKIQFFFFFFYKIHECLDCPLSFAASKDSLIVSQAAKGLKGEHKTFGNLLF